MAAVDLATFMRDRADHLSGRKISANGVEFGVPRMHYESQDSWSATVSRCRDWRAHIELSALDAHGQAPDVVVGRVDFLIVRTGLEPVSESSASSVRALARSASYSSRSGSRPTSTRTTTSPQECRSARCCSFWTPSSTTR
ncbi:MAG: hypothetical protein QOD88_1520 [Mycobacterium sp.]|nr:hypothetical protein [Mycobacterium sp.]